MSKPAKEKQLIISFKTDCVRSIKEKIVIGKVILPNGFVEQCNARFIKFIPGVRAIVNDGKLVIHFNLECRTIDLSNVLEVYEKNGNHIWPSP